MQELVALCPQSRAFEQCLKDFTGVRAKKRFDYKKPFVYFVFTFAVAPDRFWSGVINFLFTSHDE